MKIKVLTLLKYAVEEIYFIFLKGLVWTDCPLDLAVWWKQGRGSHRVAEEASSRKQFWLMGWIPVLAFNFSLHLS